MITMRWKRENGSRSSRAGTSVVMVPSWVVTVASWVRAVIVTPHPRNCTLSRATIPTR